MYLVSGAGETGSKGFTQCEFNVGGDGHGWTVGGWSITQKGNFKRLGEEFMPKYGFSPDICKTVSDADCGNGSPSRGAIDAVVERLTNKSGANPDNEDVKKFIQATTDMFANTWYATLIGIIQKYGFKTRLGMATVARAIGWTGGDSALINDPKRLTIAAYYNREEILANMPMGDETKEKQFVKLFWEGHAKRGTERWGSNNGWTNEAKAYINYINAGNMNPDTLNVLGTNISYGQLIPSYAKYQDLILPILRNCGGPPATCSGSAGAGEGIGGVVQAGENIIKLMTERNYTYKMDHGFSFTQNSTAGAAHQLPGYNYTEPNKIATVNSSSPWMDCSGFVSWVYNEIGVMTGLYASGGFHDKAFKLAPGYVASGPFPIDIAQMQPGDILWRQGHVGLYIGGGMQLDWGCVRPWGTKNPHKVEGARYTHYIRIQSTGQNQDQAQAGANTQQQKTTA